MTPLQIARKQFQEQLINRKSTLGSSSTQYVTDFSSSQEWQAATVSDLTEASELLDQLESQGFRDSEFFILDDQTFVIRWRSKS